MMYNPELDKLIELSLLDGELSEKEKQVLFKKAESLGVDLDEFEVVLEAKLFEKRAQNNAQKSNSSASPKSEKLGDVKKCPACGAITESFVSKCADCGTEFQNLNATESITKFFDKLNDLENTRKEKPQESKSSGVSFGTIIKWWLFWWILIPLKLITFLVDKSKSSYWTTTDVRKEEMILNFPVPNSKEDLFEFITLASSRIKSIGFIKVLREDGKYESRWNKIWIRKLEQIHGKAKISLKNDNTSLNEINALMSLAIKREKTSSNNVKILFIVVLVAIISIALLIYRSVNANSVLEEEQLKVKENIELMISQEKFEEALVAIKQLDDSKEAIVYRSQVQLGELTQELDSLESLLENKEYSKIQLGLDKLSWMKTSANFTEEMLERDILKTFLVRKSALNNQLPEDMRIEIEDEYSL